MGRSGRRAAQDRSPRHASSHPPSRLRRATGAVAAICAVTLPRCSAPDSADRVVARDSAGVSIVETPASVRADAGRWSLSPAPTLSIGRTDGPPEYQLLRVVAAIRLSDGRVVVADNGSTNGSLLGSIDAGVLPEQLTAGIHENTTTYVRLLPTGRLDTIGQFFGNEFLVTKEHSLTGPPFARSGVRAAYPGGFWYSANDSHELRAYSLSGRLERILRVAGAERPLTRAEIDAYVEAYLAGARDADALRRRTEYLDNAPYPETLPAFSGLGVDRAGNVWAAGYRLDDDEATEWSVFGADGGLVARLTTPGRLRVTDIGADYIMGVERDELDVEHVVVYGIVGR